MLLGDPFNFLSNWPAFKALADVPSCSFCAQIYKSEWVQKLFHRITGATGILLFYTFLPDKKLVFKPNSYKDACLQVVEQFSFDVESTFYVKLIFSGEDHG